VGGSLVCHHPEGGESFSLGGRALSLHSGSGGVVGMTQIVFFYCLHIGNIRVFCRVRPLLPTEVRTGDGLDDSTASNDSTSSGGSTSGGRKTSKRGSSSTSLQVDYPDRDNKKIALQFSGTEV